MLSVDALQFASKLNYNNVSFVEILVDPVLQGSEEKSNRIDFEKKAKAESTKWLSKAKYCWKNVEKATASSLADTAYVSLFQCFVMVKNRLHNGFFKI